jgi:hypothetical protein
MDTITIAIKIATYVSMFFNADFTTRGFVGAMGGGGV